jgi:DNA-binding CsgD family transcriptional regulator
VGLTDGELVAVQLLARGYTPEQIGALLGVHPLEVSVRLARACAVLEARNVRDAAAEALQRGLIV